jgi:hypothetical protein
LKLLPSAFEFWYLPTALAFEVTSTAFTKVTRWVTVFQSDEAICYPYTLVFVHVKIRPMNSYWFAAEHA